MQRHSFSANNSTFVVDSEYQFVEEAYGCVVAARHCRSGEGRAIKKITNITTKRILAKRCLREIRLLHHFRGHPNITHLYDMDIVFQSSGIFEVYLYEELMEANLHAIVNINNHVREPPTDFIPQILSGQPLTDAHFQSFLYQTLCGLKYIHSANVLHRDLKPVHLLVNADCELKICDFGHARSYTSAGDIPRDAGDQGFMTYVTTRWYRAPEIMLGFINYSTAIDVWSVGCILAELLGGKPIFQGRDYVDQLNQILYYCGTPSEDILRRVAYPRAQDYVRSLPIKPGVPFLTLFPHANHLAIDLLSQMLCFDPAKRISCEQALNHPYLQDWHDPADELVCDTIFDFGFEEEETIEGMKKLIIYEVDNFRAEVRAQAKAAGQIQRLDSPSDQNLSSLVPEYGPDHGAASSFTSVQSGPPSPTMDDPSEELERELAGIHLGAGRR